MSYNNPAKFSNYLHLADEWSETKELLFWVTYLTVEETGQKVPGFLQSTYP